MRIKSILILILTFATLKTWEWFIILGIKIYCTRLNSFPRPLVLSHLCSWESSSNYVPHLSIALVSPMHFVLSSKVAKAAWSSYGDPFLATSRSSSFELFSRFESMKSKIIGSMCYADELFLNGQIWPMRLSTHWQRLQMLSPILYLRVIIIDYQFSRV